MAFADRWNTRAEDLQGEWACDRHTPEHAAALYRAIDVAAPVGTVWRWLCQLRAAPYSYDWIDNRGRKSPSQLTPGLDELAVGQTVMAMFRLVEFASDDHLTLEAGRFLGLGPLLVSYRLRAREGGTRLAVKLCVGRRPGGWGAIVLRGLAIGDWIMMRKQLLNLKKYAEETALRASGGHSGATGAAG